MTELEKLLWEIERRGNAITTYELNTLGIMQYQRALKQLRERVVKNGWILTEAIKIEGQKRNNLYRLIKGKQREMF